MNTFDTIIIGSGPGGYVAAIRAAQLGMKTACIEKDSTLGGTCLNVGCIPSKALLTSSEKFAEAHHLLAEHGVRVKDVWLDLDAMMRHKSKVVQDNTSGIEYLFRKNKITHIKGYATLRDTQHVFVKGDDGSQEILYAPSIILATGSVYTQLPEVEVDEEDIVSSTGALSFKEVPESMLVIGAGYIGLEMGCVWARLGTKVTVIEFLDRILANMDRDISKNMMRILRKQGLEFRLSTKVLRAEKKDKIEVVVTSVHDQDKEEVLTAEKVLVAVGRKPFTKGLGLSSVGIETDVQGRIVTDHAFRTTVPHIFAIGDVIKGPMLAHKAEDEGVLCAEILAGQSGHIDYNTVPAVVFTMPEASQVGKTEEELQSQGQPYKIGKFPFSANGRARALSATEGFVKILADARTDRVLGVHILGADAGHLIAEMVLALEFSASAEDIARTCHAHPTLNEVVKEAALAVSQRALHL